MEKIIEKIEKITTQIEKVSSLPVYHTIKLMDDTDEFIVLNYAFQESVWSNDIAEGYTLDISILVSQESLQDLLETIKKICEQINFDLVATGINKGTFNYEAILYLCIEVMTDEV